MIDKAVRVSRRLCKILSREITKCGGMATWCQVSGRVRRDISRLSIGELPGCCQGCWGNTRAREAAAESRAWLREMKQPLPASPVFSNLTLPSNSFSARDAARRLSQRSRRSREIEMLSEAILPRIKLTINVNLIAIAKPLNE